MMQKLTFLFVVVATLTTADAWGLGECPQPGENATYSEACYKATEPPYFVCKNMTPDEWVEKALETYPRCCGDDLSDCKRPVKDYWFFENKIDGYCEKVELCDPQPIAADSSVPSVEGARFLRG